MVENPAFTKDNTTNGITISVIEVPKTVLVTDEASSKKKSVATKKDNGTIPQSYLTMFGAEFVGTALLMFVGCMGCINFESPAPPHHFGGITFGLTVMFIIQIFGHISGAHLNPAVTIATVLFGILKPLMAVVYILAQFVGAVLGYGLLKVLADSYVSEGFCATVVSDRITSFQALGIEIVITTVLILICCAVWDKRNAAKADSVPLRFGFAIAAISMASGPLTGASMNTARSFAPLVYGGNWQHHWVYWVGPNLAAIIGCALYKFLFSEPETDISKTESIYLDEAARQSADKV